MPTPELGERPRRAQPVLEGAHLRAVLESTPDAYIGLDPDGLVEEWNLRAEEVFGWSKAEVVGRPLVDLIVPPAHRDAHEQGLSRYQSTGRGSVIGRTVEITALRRDGTEFPVELTIWDCVVHGQRRLNAFVRDITDRAVTQAELARRAFYDDLTGMPNRALFLDRLGQCLSQRGKDGELVAVLAMDLDDFKTVNDSLGHAAGDTLLVEVAARLSGLVRPADTLARLAGDEFAMLVAGLSSPEDVQSVAARCLDALSAPFQVDDHEEYVQVSIGIALAGAGEASAVQRLMRDSDLAMYAAKTGGGSRYAVFEPDMHLVASRRLELKADLQRAIESKALTVAYQPIVDLRDGRLAGFEALARWQHPDRGMVSPDEFVPLAESTGLIRALDRAVLSEALDHLTQWRRQRVDLPCLRVNVNISARDLADDQLIDFVADELQRSGLPPSALMLEITESALAADARLAGERLARLKGLGVGLALDDFGRGYSSLAYLRDFPFDVIKVDRAFVERLGEDGEDALVQMVITLGHGLGLEVTAEGVETVTQLERLRSMQCDRAQGYLLARPLAAPVVTEHLRSQPNWPVVPAISEPAQPRTRGFLGPRSARSG